EPSAPKRFSRNEGGKKPRRRRPDPGDKFDWRFGKRSADHDTIEMHADRIRSTVAPRNQVVLH
ncbi:MAG: hypothetical protein ABIN58_04560, partial [candidate division WOR-3 bacterium]